MCLISFIYLISLSNNGQFDLTSSPMRMKLFCTGQHQPSSVHMAAGELRAHTERTSHATSFPAPAGVARCVVNTLFNASPLGLEIIEQMLLRVFLISLSLRLGFHLR